MCLFNIGGAWLVSVSRFSKLTGLFGDAHDYDVERLFRKARSARIASVTQELALNYAAETALNLPRSY